MLIPLSHRAVLRLSGADRVDFLQGLVSQDMALAAPDRSLYALLLTPQGKFLHDMVIHTTEDALLLDVHAEGVRDLASNLVKHKMRADVGLELLDNWTVAAGLGAELGFDLPPEPGAAMDWQGGKAAMDPRLAALGARLAVPDTALQSAEATLAAYDQHRIPLGVADGARDMETGKTVLLEANLDTLNGVSWTKGCYMGQELTARTKYRGLLKRRLVPVQVEGPPPSPGTPILDGDKEAGETRSAVAFGEGSWTLAMLRLAHVESSALTVNGTPARVTPPAWMQAAT